LYQKGFAIAFVLYVWQGLFSVMSVALFWSFAADLFNLKSGHRLFPLFAAAAALGAYTGAASTAWLERMTGPVGILCCASLLNLVNTTGEFVLASLVTEELSRMGMDDRHLAERGEFISGFYASYQSITALLGFLIQLFRVSRIYDWVGIRGALLVLPLVMIAGYGLLVALPMLHWRGFY
jgi:AAA family ATP:ADP antiporter